MAAGKRVLRGAGIAALAIAGLVIAILGALQIPPVATWAGRRLLGLAPLNPGHTLETRAVGGTWLGGLELRDVRLRRGDTVLAEIELVRVTYNPLRLLGAPALRSVEVRGAQVHARRRGNSWDVARAFRASADTGSSSPFFIDALSIADLNLDAERTADSIVRVHDVAIRARDIVLGDRVLLRLDTVAGTMTSSWNPETPVRLAARGEVARDLIRLDSLAVTSKRSNVAGRLVLPRQLDDARQVGRLSINLRAAPLALADVSPLVPALRPDGRLDADIKADAQGRQVNASVDARLGSATLRLEGSTLAGVDAPVRMRLNGELRDFDPARVLRDAPSGPVNGTVSFELDGERLARSDGRGSIVITQRGVGRTTTFTLTTEVEDGRAALRVRGRSGGLATLMRGWIRPFDSLPTYAANGAVAFPAADSTLTVRFDATGHGVQPRKAGLSARLQLAIGSGRVVARAEMAGDSSRYRLAGTIDRVAVGQLIGDTALAPVSGRFSVSGSGWSVAQTVASARLDLDDVRYRDQTLRGLVVAASVRAARATVRATGLVGDGRVVVRATVSRADSLLSFTVDSALFERMNIGALTGLPAIDGPVTVRASGRGQLGSTTRFVRASATLDSTALAGIHIQDANARLAIDGSRSTYAMLLRSSGGTVAAEARAINDSTYQIEGTLDSVDIGILQPDSKFTTRLGGRVRGSFSGASLATGDGRFTLALDQSSFNAATVGPGSIALDVARGRVTGRIALDTGDARVNIDLTGQLSTATRQLAATGSARLLRLERWMRDTLFAGSARARFDVQLTSDSSGFRGAAGSVTADARVGKLRIDTLYTRVTPGGGLNVDTLLLRSNVAQIDAAGPLALSDEPITDTFRLSGRIGDLSPVGAMLQVEQLSLDSAEITVAVSGPASHRDIALQGVARRFLYANTLVEQLDAAGQATLGHGLDALSGKIELRGVATQSITIPHAAFSGRYDSTFVFQGQADFGHGVGFDLASSGARAHDTTTIQLERVELREGGRVWNLSQPTTVIARPRDLTVRELDLISDDRRIAIDGTVSFAGSSALAVQIEQFELTALQRAGLIRVPGSVTASLQLRGPSRDPELTGAVNLKLREGSASGVTTALTWSTRGLRIEMNAEDDAGHVLTVSGRVPWGFALGSDTSATRFVLLRDPGDSLQLEVRATEFDLGLFEPFLPIGTGRDLRGRLLVNAQISGTPEHATARGSARVDGLGLEVPLTAVRYRNGRVQASLNGAVVRFDTLTVETGNDQRLTASGNIRLQPITDPALELTAELRNFAVANEGILEARATGVVQVKGTVGTPLVNGSLVMGHTEFNAPAAAALEVADVTLTEEDRLELARHFGPRVLAGIDAPVRILDRFGLDLDVRLPQQVWFRRHATPKIDVEVTGRVRVQQQPYQEMQFFGTVEPLPGRSTLDLLGRTFELTSGDIALNGPIEQARVNVSAQYLPPIEGGADDNSVVVTVVATGRLDSLGLDFSSDPSMSRDDIISYIVTGRPASDNPLIAQSSGSQGESLVFGQLSEALTDVVSRELGFDVFQIRQEPAQGLVLTAGRYVTSRFYASLQQPLELGGDAKRLPGTTLGPGFELQYRLNPWLRINIRGGSLPTGILLRSRYAY